MAVLCLACTFYVQPIRYGKTQDLNQEVQQGLEVVEYVCDRSLVLRLLGHFTRTW